jgi:type IV secretion system pilin
VRRFAILLVSLLWLLLPVAAFADNNPLSGACAAQGGAGKASAACANPGGDPIAGPGGVIYKATLIIATIAGISAVFVVIVGGFMLVTANGDSQKVAQARTAIIGAFVGLTLIAIATSIVVFVVGKL